MTEKKQQSRTTTPEEINIIVEGVYSITLKSCKYDITELGGIALNLRDKLLFTKGGEKVAKYIG